VTPQRWNEVKALLAEALESTAEQRTALLAAADPELARQVEAYLALDTELGDFIERPVFDLHDDVDPAVRVGERLGPYRLAREIGSGGMGAVYQALRADEEYEQSVAVKVLKRGLDTAEVVHRFRTERQILAGLEHPNVARLLDGGTTPDGRPYLVMEYVEGKPIDVWCDERGLGVDERLELFLAVCEGVKFAHRSLVVHRDLKPSNILVTADGVPKLLDFGIARLLDDDGPSLPTVGAWRFLTPEYASPEQVTGQPITTATDVYSLGVLLYQLLTDRRPYDLEERSARGLAAALARGEPAKPSAVAAEERRKRLRGDLDNIALTALRREPERRYGSAGELADDVRRHLDGLPVRATPDSWRYRAGKFVKRHRVGVAAAVVIAVLLVGFSGVAWVLTKQAEAARERAEEGEARAQRVVELMQEVFSSADPDRPRSEEITVGEALDKGVEKIIQQEDDPRVRATLLQTAGETYIALGDNRQATKTLNEAYDLRVRELGENHPLVAETLTSLANLRRRSDPDRAERMLHQALKMTTGQLPADDPKVLSIRNNLGTLYHQTNRCQEAEQIHQGVLADRRRSAPGDWEELAHSLYNLATAKLCLKKLDEAEPLFAEALLLRERYGDSAEDRYRALNGWASILQERGELELAGAFFDEAVNVLRSRNEEHPQLAIALNNRGLALQDLGRLDDAERDLREANERLDYKQPTLKTNLAALLLERQDLSEAARLVDELEAELAKKPPPQDWRRADLASVAGGILAARGRYAEAETRLLKSYESLAASVSANQRNVLAALDRIIRLYEAWGKPEKAAEWRTRREAPAVAGVEGGT